MCIRDRSPTDSKCLQLGTFSSLLESCGAVSYTHLMCKLFFYPEYLEYRSLQATVTSRTSIGSGGWDETTAKSSALWIDSTDYIFLFYWLFFHLVFCCEGFCEWKGKWYCTRFLSCRITIQGQNQLHYNESYSNGLQHFFLYFSSISRAVLHVRSKS